MNRFPFDWRRIALVVGVLFLVVLIVDFNARLEELNRLNNQVEITRLEATQAGMTKVAYETQIANANTNQKVEEEARSNAGMILEDDHPVVVIGDDPSQAPLEIPEPTPLPTPKPKWQLWWDLYFGGE